MGNLYEKDRYDKSKYIPKGYILSDGTMLTKEYGRFHEDMARRYIEENFLEEFQNDIIEDYKDYIIMRLGAVQIMSHGRPIILFCEGYKSPIVQEAIVSYLSHGWEQIIISNPYASIYDYIRCRIFFGTSIFYMEEENEKKIGQSKVFKKCE